MLTMLYLALMSLAIAGVWLTHITDSTSADRVYTCVLLLSGGAVTMWVDTMRICGMRCLRGVPIMAQALARSTRGRVLMVVVAVALSSTSDVTAAHSVGITVTLVATVALLWLQPPYALVLGASTPRTATVLRIVRAMIFPLRAVELLDRRVGSDARAYTHIDNLHTRQDRGWPRFVGALMDVVELIVLDGRTERRAVHEELVLLRDDPDLWSRTLVVVEADGSAPVLTLHGLSGATPGVHATTAETIVGDLALRRRRLRRRPRVIVIAGDRDPPEPPTQHRRRAFRRWHRS